MVQVAKLWLCRLHNYHILNSFDWQILNNIHCAETLCMSVTSKHVWPNCYGSSSLSLPTFYESSPTSFREFICSQPGNRGLSKCSELPPFYADEVTGLPCNETAAVASPNGSHCINWNEFYTECLPVGENPMGGSISFDNIGYASVTIFQVHVIISIFNHLVTLAVGMPFPQSSVVSATRFGCHSIKLKII